MYYNNLCVYFPVICIIIILVYIFQFPELLGIHGWHWEVAFTFTETLADIALHGKTSRCHFNNKFIFYFSWDMYIVTFIFVMPRKAADTSC